MNDITPRCSSCEAMLVHAGAICVTCDDTSHYEAPVRTSPPIRMPVRERAEAASRVDGLTRRGA